MLLDHIAVRADDPSAFAARLADELGRPWRDGGVSEDGYRSAAVLVGNGIYVDALAAVDHSEVSVREVFDSTPDGAPLGWAIDVTDARRVAAELGLCFERHEDDLGTVEMAGWPEALRSRGLQPYFVFVDGERVRRPGRERTRWLDEGIGGVDAITLTGTASDRKTLERMLCEVAAVDRQAPTLDVQFRWRNSGSPALAAVSFRAETGAVQVGAPE